MVKSEVDEKNLDEEISKIKEKLAAKVAERSKSSGDSIARPPNDDDEFFNAAGGSHRNEDTAQTRRSRSAVDDDNDKHE